MDQIHGNPTESLMPFTTDILLAIATSGYRLALNATTRDAPSDRRVCVLTIAAGASEVNLYLTLDQLDAIEKLIGSFAQDLLADKYAVGPAGSVPNEAPAYGD